MWLATFDGLVRFDGDQFVTFNSANTPAFSTNRITTLIVDRHNNLWIVTDWIGNDQALIKYHRGQFTAFGSEDSLMGDINVQLSSAGNLLIGSDNGAFFYDGKALKSFGDELAGKSVRNIVNDSEGIYWFSTNHGVFRYKNVHWTQLTEKDGLDSENIYAVHINQYGKLLIGSETSLSLWEDGRMTTRLDFQEPVKKYLAIHGNPSKPNEILLVHNKAYIYAYKHDQLLPYPNIEVRKGYRHNLIHSPSGAIWSHTRNKVFHEGKLVYTTDGYINHLLYDNFGNIWVAQSNGLVQIKRKLIKAYNKNISAVYSLLEDLDGEIWATQSIRDLFRFQGDHFQKVIDHSGSPQLIYSLQVSADSLLWIGTRNGVLRWDKKSDIHVLQPAMLTDSVPVMHDIRAIQEDAYGNMWFGGLSGIHQLDKKDKWHYLGKIDKENPVDVRIIYRTHDSTLWVGTNGDGLLYLKEGKLHQLKTKQTLSGNVIRSIYEDNDGILWVGTEGFGLNRIELGNPSGIQDAQITVYNKQNGLFDNIIHQILEDDNGRLWMSSNRGIFWVNRSELTALAKGKTTTIFSFSYDEQDGLPGREANGGMQPAGFKSQKNELWFPMMGGVVHIDPGQIVIPTLNVFIKELSTSDSTFYIGDIEKKEFPIGQRDLEISFTALNFSTRSANIRYRYKLVGYNKEWIEAENDREATYNNLGPGTYTFNVKANNGGGWSMNQTSLEISIPYFFYETYWFYAIVMLLIVFTFYGGVNWRTRNLKQKGKELELKVKLRTQELRKEKEETVRQKDIATEALVTIEKQAAALLELDRAKSHFFTNVSHEFRTPLTLIIGPLEDYISKFQHSPNSHTEEMEMALRNSKRLLKLVNQLLEVAKLDSGHIKLNAEVTDIRTVIESVTDAFLSLAERNGTRLISKLPSSPVLVYCDTDLVEKAVINLVSNAFKFTQKEGRIEIQLIHHTEHVLISIKDNGLGIHKKEHKHVFDRFHQVNESTNEMQVGTGIGLSLSRELIVLHGGDIELNSELGVGSEFVIKLPMGTAHVEAYKHNATQNLNKVELIGDLADTLAEEITPSPKQNRDIEKNMDQPILLIVEDNADIRKYIRKHFSTEYRIIEAKNGQEGLQMAEEALPDLIISDVMMPIMDGYELCRMIKQHPDLDFIPVILLTANAETSQKIEGLEIGADDYVTKPFKIDILRARVNNLIQSRKKLRERLADTKMPPDTSDMLGWGGSPFAKHAQSIIDENIDNENFSVAQLAETLKIGRTTLYSRTLELTGKTPIEVIKLSRIYRAAQFLKENTGNISEVAYTTGFKSVSHFSRTFKGEFDITPSEYKRKHTGS